jgi:beta-galactosidase GanA
LDGAKVAATFASIPEDVEVLRRVAARRAVNIFINHGQQPQSVTLPKSMRDVLHAGQSIRNLTLAPQAVAVLEE